MKEEGLLSLSESEVGENVTESSVSLGREVTEDGMPDEQGMDELDIFNLE